MGDDADGTACFVDDERPERRRSIKPAAELHPFRVQYAVRRLLRFLGRFPDLLEARLYRLAIGIARKLAMAVQPVEQQPAQRSDGQSQFERGAQKLMQHRQCSVGEGSGQV